MFKGFKILKRTWNRFYSVFMKEQATQLFVIFSFSYNIIISLAGSAFVHIACVVSVFASGVLSAAGSLHSVAKRNMVIQAVAHLKK